MFTELLGALNGNVGERREKNQEDEEGEGGRGPNLFVFGKRMDGKEGFLVSKDIDFISEGEREGLNEIVNVGYFVKQWNQWIINHQLGDSIYSMALANSISLLLDNYQSILHQLHQDHLNSPFPLPIPHIHSKLHSFLLLFSILWQNIIISPPILSSSTSSPSDAASSTTKDVLNENRNLGIHYLDIIYSLISKTAVIEVKKGLETIFFQLLQVLYRQILGWMAYGLLLDPHNEFFIQLKQEAEEKKINDKTSSESLSYLWNNRYFLSIERLPSFISKDTADTILFVGKVAKLLHEIESERTNLKRTYSSSKDILDFTQAISSLASQPNFSSSLFHKVVERIRHRIAKYLWDLIIEDANLLHHLTALKDYFLMFKGDFWHCFFNESRQLMLLPPKSSAEHDLQILFSQSASKSNLEESPYFSKFRLLFDPTSKDEYFGKQLPWSSISLQFPIGWPLELLFSQSVMRQYNQLFRFLWITKLVQFELENVWLLDVEEKVKSVQAMPIWLLRSKMGYFVNSLIYYFQVDVLEALSSQLIKHIEKTSDDFEGVSRAIEHFLNCSTFQLFLQVKSLSKELEQIYSLCLQFCSLIQNSQSNNEDVGHKVQSISTDFEKHTQLFCTILLGMKGHRLSSPQLSRLILTLDSTWNHKRYSQQT